MPWRYRAIHKDGSTVWLEGTGTNMLHVPEVGAIVVNYRDITARMQAEEQIRFQAHLLDCVSQSVIATNLQGQILYWNSGAEALYGWQGQEVLGEIITSIIPTETTPEESLERFARLRSGQSTADEMRLYRRDGSPVYVHVTASPITDEEGELIGIVGISHDITARRRADDQIRFQAHLLDSVGQAVIATDLEGHILYWNRFAETMYGWSAEEVVGRNIVGVTTNEATTEQARQIMAQLAKGETWQGEFPVTRRDGTLFPALVSNSPILSEDGELMGIIGVSADMSKVKAAEAHLHHLERMHHVLFETMAQGVIYQDAESVIISANPAAERVLGLSLDQMQGRAASDIRWQAMSEDGSPLPNEQLPSSVALRTGQPVRKVMAVFNPVMEMQRWLEVSSIPQFREGEERPYQVFNTFSDITDRQRHEQELEAMVTISAALRAASSRAELLEQFLEHVMTILQAEGVASVRLDSETNELEVEMALGLWGDAQGFRSPPSVPSLTSKVMDSQQPYLNNNIFAEGRLINAAMPLLGELQAVIIAPLIAEEQAIGALWVGRHMPFSPHDLQLITAVVEIAASAINRQALHQQTEQHLARLTILRNIDQAITSSLDVRLVLDVLLSHTLEHMGADAATVLLYNSQSLTLGYGASRGFHSNRIRHSTIRLGQGMVGQAALERRLCR